MNQTMAQKIIARHSKTQIAGETVISLDRVFCHEITTPAAIRMLQERGQDAPFAVEQIAAILDHVSPSKDSHTATQARELRDWTQKHGVTFYDVGRNGVCHVVFAEHGWVEPGMTVVMGDSHTCTHGALGAFAFGVGTTDLAVAMARGVAVMSAPESICIELWGERSSGVSAKDVALSVIARLGHGGATGCVLEFAGPAAATFTVEERMTLCNMAVECGATMGIFPVDAQTIEFMRNVGVDVDESRIHNWREVNADVYAQYIRTEVFDLSRMQAVTTWGERPDQIMPLEEMPFTPVQQVWIGSCTNGRISDLRIVADAVRGKLVAPGVRAIVTPASTAIWKQAMAEGLFEILSAAGFCITSPGCGACIGMSGGVLAPGEVCASTSNRNFSGRMGVGGHVHLMSPASAAQVAVQGYFGKVKE